jgi:hypothetical protein
MDDGLTYDMATRQVSDRLKSLFSSIRVYTGIFVFIVSALVAPGSRKNGTTQFVLSFQISRTKLALAQFTALCLFITAAVLILHLGLGIMAFHLKTIGMKDLLFGWVTFLVPVLMVAASGFSLSLSLSPITVYLILGGIPVFVLSLTESLFSGKLAAWIPVPVARLVDNVALLFPNPGSFLYWPRLTAGLSVTAPPYPLWSWALLNFLFATVFWVGLGYTLYLSHNIGSRQVMK